MEFSTLYDMITYLQYGTNLHIGVLFFSNYGNEKLWLPHKHNIHSSIICDEFKINYDSYKKCFGCRNLVLNKAIRTKTAFGGLCINGLFEYTHPVIINNEVACIIFIGNILDKEKGYHKLLKNLGDKASLIHSTENDFSIEKCKAVSALLESYILLLLEKYPSAASNSLIENIKSYIDTHCEFNLKISHVAEVFHYNEQYFGRLLKKETNMSFNDYVNFRRLEKAKELLKNSDDTIINISLKAGFNHVTYFNRLFKRRFGVTPTQYRKNM